MAFFFRARLSNQAAMVDSAREIQREGLNFG